MTDFLSTTKVSQLALIKPHIKIEQSLKISLRVIIPNNNDLIAETNNSHHPNLFQKVGNSIVTTDDMRSFAPQAFANIVWAYAKTKTQR